MKCNISEIIIHIYSVSNMGQFALNCYRVIMGFSPAEQTRNWTFTFVFVYIECDSCCL